MEQTLKKFMESYKHLGKFYKTKKEFKQHILSGEVKITIPDMIKFVEDHEKKYNEIEMILLLQKALTHKDDGETGSLVTAQGKIRPANFHSWFEQFKKK
jgi:hypothetical protein